jgi:hypothetical protein
MPPDSTQNLNAKLSGRRRSERRRVGFTAWKASPIQSSAPPVRIVGEAVRYRGGYRLNV